MSAVDRRADDEHGGACCERAEERYRGEEAKPVVVEAPQDGEQREAGGGVHPLLHEELHRVAAVDRGTGRGGAVDHHQSERHQREGHEDQEALLELALHYVEVLCQPAELLPTVLETRELVERGAGRRQQDDVARLGSARRSRIARSRSPERTERDASVVEGGFDLGGGLADEIGAIARLECGREGRIALLLATAAENHVLVPARKRPEGAQRGGDVRRLRVVHVGDAANDGDLLDPVLDTGKGAERFGDGGVAQARGARGGGRGGSVLAIVRSRDQGLGRERVVSRELDPACETRDRTEAAGHDGYILHRLSGEDAQLRVGVGLERAVAVEMVGLEVREHGDPRCQGADAFELKRRELADDPGVVDDRPDESRRAGARCCRRPRRATRRLRTSRREAPSWWSCRSCR